MTNQCPSDEQMRDLLADRIPAALEAELTAHVECCPRCLAEMEELTALPAVLDGRAGEPPCDSNVSRLRGLLTANSEVKR